MCAQDRRLSRLKINSIANQQLHAAHFSIGLPLDLPVHASCESLIVIGTKAHVQHRSSMLKLIQ